MFYAHEVRNLLRLAIFEHRRGRLGSKISGYGQLAEVAVYFAMSGLPPEADTNRKGRHVRWVPQLVMARLGGVQHDLACDVPAHQSRCHPSGKSRQQLVQSPLRKYSPFVLTQISSFLRLSHPARGAARDRHETRGGMRWPRWTRLTSVTRCGRRSRVVLAPRRWRQVSRVTSWSDGGKKARSPGRARSKP